MQFSALISLLSRVIFQFGAIFTFSGAADCAASQMAFYHCESFTCLFNQATGPGKMSGCKEVLCLSSLFHHWMLAVSVVHRRHNSASGGCCDW